MPIQITMPALSRRRWKRATSPNGWSRKATAVSSGDVIAEIETDKATMEVEAVDEGHGCQDRRSGRHGRRQGQRRDRDARRRRRGRRSAAKGAVPQACRKRRRQAEEKPKAEAAAQAAKPEKPAESAKPPAAAPAAPADSGAESEGRQRLSPRRWPAASPRRPVSMSPPLPARVPRAASSSRTSKLLPSRRVRPSSGTRRRRQPAGAALARGKPASDDQVLEAL
jgi:pyruvate dehydrogenase E2 component (dihydrolipoamide acetyltransferase)